MIALRKMWRIKTRAKGFYKHHILAHHILISAVLVSRRYLYEGSCMTLWYMVGFSSSSPPLPHSFPPPSPLTLTSRPSYFISNTLMETLFWARVSTCVMCSRRCYMVMRIRLRFIISGISVISDRHVNFGEDCGNRGRGKAIFVIYRCCFHDFQDVQLVTLWRFFICRGKGKGSDKRMDDR